MFTVELKKNSELIAHIYGRSIYAIGDNLYKYHYEYYRVESRIVINGEVSHDRRDGLEKLVKIILDDAIE